jgi:hypothetical protein
MNDSTQDPIQQFLYWQCRIRQTSVRVSDGRLTEGMRPSVTLPEGGNTLGNINVLIVKDEPVEYTSQFKFIVRKTHDPAERVKNGLQILAEAYYQQPRGFSRQIVALFGLDSEPAQALIEAGKCTLDFAQESQTFELNCVVRDLPENDQYHQAIFWHNSMFNPGMPGRVRVLGFTPEDS